MFRASPLEKKTDAFSLQGSNEREFDEEDLGRGHLGQLSDENFEFGAWTPVEVTVEEGGEAAVAKGLGESALELLGGLFGGEEVVDRRGEARPFTDAVTVQRARARADSSPRAPRDSELLLCRKLVAPAALVRSVLVVEVVFKVVAEVGHVVGSCSII